MNTKRIHLIQDKEDWIIYFCDTVQYRRISGEEKACFDCILQGKSEEEYLLAHPSASRALYQRCLEELRDDGATAAEVPEEALRLTLNVANACNMNCGYCYANGGTYHSQENLMSLDVAEKAIDVFVRKYGRIGSIKFIGGEPLLNKAVVCGVCDYVDGKYRAGAIPEMPDFIIATNGTILDDELIQYSIRYNWRVGLSFDGPAQIHEMVRTFRNGSSTVDAIQANIKRWKDATNGRCPSSVNACYSGVHQANHVSVVDAVKYMKEELGIEKVNVVPVDASKDSSFALTDNTCFISAVKEILSPESEDYRAYMFTKLKRLEKILRGHLSMSEHVCKAGLTTFGVSTKGTISPCHMLTDENGFYMGSVFDEAPLDSQVFQTIQEKLRGYNRYDRKPCDQCFANRLCIGCLGGNAFRTGDPYRSDPAVCAMIKGAVEELVKDITRTPPQDA